MIAVLDYHGLYTLPAALALLPAAHDTPAARAMLLAIGQQESGFSRRDQSDAGRVHGPALGFWQFEMGGGVAGVLTHRDTQPLIARVLEELRYPPAARACWEAIEHNDVLAAIFARLLLSTSPQALPDRGNSQAGWALYTNLWRPGAPRRATWDGFFAAAWATVAGPLPVETTT